ncbi:MULTISPECIES: hypothetical protein [Vagococcus]|uniref:Lipoprotein n=1 Tax=Vagococcus fluvialis bH819 TaxID=1255619 RepID=A0A1X6WQ15_9ENTE|nr:MULTISPECIES: hypothetical protein [Vagococcus]SLM86431.1 hypothetical protein FM121_10090 [Vagococcus fluvialis bH819]HCM90639.1 hypothetical protein [Vagococcus sp.]
MKKIIFVIFSVLSVIFLASCSQTSIDKEKEQVKETTAENALMYTFKLDDNSYRFRLLDGWIKFPSEDKRIAFLVANKETKSYMSAGFEEKKGTLEEYKDSFVPKVTDASGKILEEPKKKDLNGLPAYYLSFTMKDNKKRDLTYKTYLVETSDYFINLGAWTSDESPSDKILRDLDKMLSTFEEVKKD